MESNIFGDGASEICGDGELQLVRWDEDPRIDSVTVFAKFSSIDRFSLEFWERGQNVPRRPALDSMICNRIVVD